MDLYIFNKEFEMQGVVDSFTSLIWRREFYKTGTFELHLSLPREDNEASNLVELLKKGNLVVKEDSPEEAAYIETIKLSDEEKETMIISGYFIDNFISERFIWEEMSKNGTAELVIKYFVEKNCVTPSNTNRILPHFTISANRGITKLANEVDSYGNVAIKTEELALKYDLGWRVLFDLVNRQYVFDVFEGRDLSVGQTINPRAIFSLEYENVLQQSYTNSDSGYKNMVMVAGIGEGIERKKVLLNDNLSGFDRRELFIDAKDISNIREDETILTDQEYNALLTERGQSKLSEAQTIRTFESGIIVNSNLVYKQDYDLGDIVTTLNNRWGVMLNTRITIVEEVYENDTLDIRLNFGSNIPTVFEKLEKKMR
jgi:hypothetical protein